MGTICGHREVLEELRPQEQADRTSWQHQTEAQELPVTLRCRTEATNPAFRALRAVRTFCTSSSRADTARTRRRLLRPALAPAPLRERAGRLARDTVARCGGCRGCVRDREARELCGAVPQRQARCASRSARPLRAVDR